MTPVVRRAVWLTLYATAMGLLEAAVVVYLRELYYPNGFSFPIQIIPPRIALVEILREATTLLMLLAVAVLAARDRTDGFFVFSFLFGCWDIVYYLGLRLFLGWPESVWTWDLLFLIPVPWLSPVVYPVAISALLIAGFAVHERLRVRGRRLLPSGAEWACACAGGALVIAAFCWHWRVVSRGTLPGPFPAWLFALGLAAGSAPFARALRRAS